MFLIRQSIVIFMLSSKNLLFVLFQNQGCCLPKMFLIRQSIVIFMLSSKNLLFAWLQNQGQQFVKTFIVIVFRFATASWFNINVLKFYQITQLNVQLASNYANGAISEKMVSVKRCILKSYHPSKKKKKRVSLPQYGALINITTRAKKNM